MTALGASLHQVGLWVVANLPALAALLAALLVSPPAVALVLRQAAQRGLVDTPGGRKSHTTAVPRIGGVGILAGYLAGLAVASCFGGPLSIWNTKYLAVLAGSLVIFGVGLADDLLHRPAGDAGEGRDGLSASTKLLLQIVAAVIAMSAGVRIKSIQIPGDGFLFFSPAVSWTITAIWIVGIANALNWIDGLDGLAGGVSLLMAASIALIAMFGPASDAGATVFALSMLGGIVGFLKYNFPPARIFMGDGGSNLLGYLLATLAIAGVMKGATVLAVLTPILILALPIVNLTGVVVGRVLRGQNPMAADRSHLHHRLTDAGWPDLSALLFVYAVTGLCGSASLALMGLSDQAAFMAIGVAILLVGVAARRAPIQDAERAEDVAG